MSNIAYCAAAETWPEAGVLPLSVLNNDGEYAAIYGEDGHSEVVLLGPSGRERLVIPVRFDTLEQGLRAGKILADAFAAVRDIQDEEPAYYCEHRKVRFTFLARMDGKHGICEGCGKNLGVISIAAYRDFREQGLSDNEIVDQL